eukprot:357023-Chlamydomonas_euryale.AAC.6
MPWSRSASDVLRPLSGRSHVQLWQSSQALAECRALVGKEATCPSCRSAAGADVERLEAHSQQQSEGGTRARKTDRLFIIVESGRERLRPSALTQGVTRGPAGQKLYSCEVPGMLVSLSSAAAVTVALEQPQPQRHDNGLMPPDGPHCASSGHAACPNANDSAALANAAEHGLVDV